MAIFGEIRASKYARGYMRNEYSGPPAGVRDKMVAQGGHDHLDARSYTNDRDVTKGAAATTCCASTTGTPWTGL